MVPAASPDRSAQVVSLADHCPIRPGWEVVNEWAGYMRAAGQSPNTIKIRTRTISSLCNALGIDDPLAISRRDVITFLARPTKAWTRLTYWSSIDAWGRYVREFADLPDFDPVKGIPKPRTPDAVARPITDADVTRLLSAHLQWRTRAYILLALFQGLRCHEIAKIHTRDVDLAHGLITILGKGGTERTIPLHREVLAMAELSMPLDGWWFPSRSHPDRPVAAGQVSETITRAMERLGIHATAHQLRDTFATRIQRETGDIPVTQTMLRHKNVQSTVKYTAVSDDVLRDALATVAWAAEQPVTAATELPELTDADREDPDVLEEYAAALLDAARQLRTH